MDRAGTGFSRYGSECLFRLPILHYLLSVNEHSLEHEEEGFCQTDFDKFVEGDNLLPLDSRELLIAHLYGHRFCLYFCTTRYKTVLPRMSARVYEQNAFNLQQGLCTFALEK